MYESLDEIKKVNEAHGHHFFSNTWYTQIADETIYGGRYFISKESLNIGSVVVPESFTIREVLESGAISTVGLPGDYKTLEEAQNKLKEMGVK